MSDKLINKIVKLLIVLIAGSFLIAIGMLSNLVYFPLFLNDIGNWIYLLPYIVLSVFSGIVIGIWIRASTREKLIWTICTIIIDTPIILIVGAFIWENLWSILHNY